MFDKLKSLKRKKEAKIEKKDNTLIKVIIISSILGLFTMFITSSFLSFILIIICSIISYFIIYPQKMNDDKEEKIRAKFYHDFIIYSSLYRNYCKGLKHAKTLLPISKFKEKISNIDEQEKIDFKGVTTNKEEIFLLNKIFHMKNKVFNSEEIQLMFSNHKIQNREQTLLFFNPSYILFAIFIIGFTLSYLTA